MIYFPGAAAGTALTIRRLFCSLSFRAAREAHCGFGKYLGFWAFTLAGLLILGAVFAAAHAVTLPLSDACHARASWVDPPRHHPCPALRKARRLRCIADLRGRRATGIRRRRRLARSSSRSILVVIAVADERAHSRARFPALLAAERSRFAVKRPRRGVPGVPLLLQVIVPVTIVGESGV